MSLGELYDPTRGFLVEDTCVIEAEVAVYKAMDHWLYDSKKETGFVGLKNQGATCYMNSLLQTLYHIPYFRKVSICPLTIYTGFAGIESLLKCNDHFLFFWFISRLSTTCQLM